MNGVRTERNHGEGLRGLREANRSGIQLQIPGTDNNGGGQRLASSGGKPGEGEEDLGKADKDPEQGRGGQEGVRYVLQSGGTAGATVWSGDVGADPTDREGSG